MKPPRVKERKLGREKALGLCWQGVGLIEVDPRLKARAAMDTLLHEMLHHYAPDWSETRVSKTASAMTTVLWMRRFRRVEK
jgi:hypothetical protein